MGRRGFRPHVLHFQPVMENPDVVSIGRGELMQQEEAQRERQQKVLPSFNLELPLRTLW